MPAEIVDVWHKKTHQHTRLPRTALEHFTDYTTTKPSDAAVKAAEKNQGA